MSSALSIIIPVYNEAATLREIITRVQAVAQPDGGLTLEIVLIDDASTDGSWDIAQELAKTHGNIVLHRHDINSGKGAAVTHGFQMATGRYVVVQDADLEYDPRDLAGMYDRLASGQADIMLGSRFLSGANAKFLYGLNYISNKFLTWLSNLLSRQNITDMETCYKMFATDIARGLNLQERRFGIEPELIARLAHYSRKQNPKLRWAEVPIFYQGRSYYQGKKIRLRDGIRAIYCIIVYNLF